MRWSTVVLGWLVAFVLGGMFSPLVRYLYELATKARLERGEFTLGLMVVSLVSGFLAYLIGGYVAGRLAHGSSTLHGAAAAVLGGVVGLVLSIFGAVFAEAVAVPPASFGTSDGALIAGLALFLVNLFGGYVGSKLGEPPPSELQRPQ